MQVRPSEGLTGMMEIEQYIAAGEPFRSTTQKNPLPHPVIFEEVLDSIKRDVTRLFPDISQKLMSRCLSNHSIRIVNISKPGYPGGDDPVSKLVIDLNSPDGGSFGPICDEHEHLLNRHGLRQVQVEVLNPHFLRLVSLLPVEPTDPAVSVYRQIRAGIAQQLEETRVRWNSMCLFNVRASDTTVYPTVVITVARRTSYNWERLHSSIESKVTAALSRGLSMRVEILPGNCQELPPRGGLLMANRMKGSCHPEMGFSIGVRGEGSGGTLGAFVNMTVGDEPCKPCLLTSHHVVEPATYMLSTEREEAGRYGIKYSSTSQNRPVVQHLAQKNVAATREKLEKYIKKYRADIGRYKTEHDARELAGSQPKYAARIPALLRLEKDRKLGDVSMSSGKTVNQRNILDWALVQIDTAHESLGPNILPHVRDSDQHDAYGRQNGGYHIAGTPVVDFGKIIPGEWYFKAGRTTDITSGVCNGVEAHTRWSDANRNRYDVNGKEVDMAANYTEEYMILSKKTDTAEYQQGSFCGPGDSGSVIINRNVALCGLLYGEISS